MGAHFLSITTCFGAKFFVQTHMNASFMSATICFGDDLFVKTHFGQYPLYCCVSTIQALYFNLYVQIYRFMMTIAMFDFTFILDIFCVASALEFNITPLLRKCICTSKEC